MLRPHRHAGASKAVHERGTVTFKIYLRRFGKLIALEKLSRTSKGLYFISPRGGGDHITYHEDGKWWVQRRQKLLGWNERFVKKIRQPLFSFAGIETLSTARLNVFGPMPDDPDEAEVRQKKEDIVIDFAATTFGIETILSDRIVQLPQLPERVNPRVFVKDWKPFIIIETFELADNSLPLVDRFPPSTTWIEDKNFFINHIGKI
jgi:hypothetical protein